MNISYLIYRLNSERFVVHQNLLIALLLAQSTLVLSMNVVEYPVCHLLTNNKTVYPIVNDLQ